MKTAIDANIHSLASEVVNDQQAERVSVNCNLATLKASSRGRLCLKIGFTELRDVEIWR
jgi:hypothetical protein